MKLFDVKVSMLVMAQDRESAMKEARARLSGERDLDFNYLVHDAEVDESHSSLADLRKKQSA